MDNLQPLKKYIGRDYETYNCLDLVKEFYKDLFGLDVKNYYEGPVPNRREVQSLIVTNRGDFIEIPRAERKFGDLVLIKLYGIECHIGVVVDASRFLHSAKHIGSNIDRLERYSKLISGYYRHREVPA